MRPWLSLSLLALAACTDFATPAQLERTTIIAVVADPPIVQPGQQARLSVVVADKTGVVTVPSEWTLGEAFPGIAPMGTLAADGDGALYTAPAMIPADRPANVPPLDSVEVTVQTSDGPLSALKAMPVLAMDAANPTITALAVGDGDALAGPVTVGKGATVALSVTTDPPMGEMARYAWYTTVGEIRYYQSNPCELVVPADGASGPLLVVVRDGAGGVVWRAASLQVQ